MAVVGHASTCTCVGTCQSAPALQADCCVLCCAVMPSCSATATRVLFVGGLHLMCVCSWASSLLMAQTEPAPSNCSCHGRTERTGVCAGTVCRQCLWLRGPVFDQGSCVTRCDTAVSGTSGTCLTHAVQLHTAAAAQLLLPGLQQQVWLFVRLFLQVRCTAAALLATGPVSGTGQRGF